MKRLFRCKSEQVGDRRIALHRITCACGNTDKVSTSAGGNPMPQEFIAKHFRHKGWEVGDRDGDDVCPSCVDKRKAERRRSRLKLVKNKAATAAPEAPQVIAAETIMEPTLAEPAQATKPEDRTQTREDRRIIFAAINDVYLDAERGYKPGWSDKRVAEGLGIPVSWAKDIRDEMFGPEGESAELRLLAEQIEALREEALRDVEQMATIISSATRRMDELSHRIGALSSQAERLSAALS